MDDLHAVEAWLHGLLARLSPAARRDAVRDVAREVRRSQQERVAKQKNPDGNAYAQRQGRASNGRRLLRGKRGRIKRTAMFKKLRTTRFLQIQADERGFAIGFAGRVARLARIHQFGEESRVAPYGPVYRYPVRALLGFTVAEREMIRNRLLRHLN